jgi:WD40 repeat protein
LAWSPDSKRLASASSDATLLIWAAGIQADGVPIRMELSELKSCWTILAGDDAAKAYKAIGTLTQGAKDTVPFLAERLKPVRRPDAKRVSQLIDRRRTWTRSCLRYRRHHRPSTKALDF